jgi:OFA family oxalate/formate antiporter-like MFS transporter
MQGAAPAGVSTVGPQTNRWAQLVLCIICMVMIANLQYGWTLFVHPMHAAHHWAIADIQVAFSIFVALETWLTPLEGWIVDRLGPTSGPKLMIAFGGVLVAIAWIIDSMANTLGLLYLGAVLFGAGAALTVIPIRAVIAAAGYATAFFWFGLIQGVIVFIVAWWLRAPLAGEAPSAGAVKVVQTSENYTPQQMLKTLVFWVLYVMFILVAASGLMATAQIALIARDFHVAKVVILFGGTALSVALIIDNVANGAARPLFGWVSDQIGREYTMAIAFGLGGISYWLLGAWGASPWAFVVFAALIFLTWGEIFSLFPSTCTDSFGPRYATANLSFLYTAKGVAAFLVPAANLLKAATGSWHAVFIVTAIMNFVTVALALFVLRPLRTRQTAAHPAGRLAGAE